MSNVGQMGGPLVSILLQGKSSLQFILGVILSFAFSISVILGTVGIMDGFEATLKKGLKNASGDFTLSSRAGAFEVDEELKQNFRNWNLSSYTEIVQTEGFAIHDEVAKGVLIRGIDPKTFSKISELPSLLLNGLQKDEVILGSELYEQLGRPQKEVALVFASAYRPMPILKRFRVKGFVRHGIYKKDLRFLYVQKEMLQDILELSHRVHFISFNIPQSQTTSFEQFETLLKKSVALPYIVKPYWKEFDSLLEAVKVEKFSIGLILQLVVIVAIFNVMSYIIFLNEKRSQEIFLLEALGASKKMVASLWMKLILFIWAVSCVLSIFFAQIFNWGLMHLNLFKMPGDIYSISRLSLKLSPVDYLFVFGLALLWVFLMSLIGLIRLQKKTILSGLRKEFS